MGVLFQSAPLPSVPHSLPRHAFWNPIYCGIFGEGKSPRPWLPAPGAPTSTWASSQSSRRTDFTLLTCGMLRWMPEQFKQMKIPRLWDAQSGSGSKKGRGNCTWLVFWVQGRGESPGLMCLILKASDTRKINVSIYKNTK